MPSTIPYSPSLTLGSVITPSVMEALTKISHAQAPIDAAQENLSSLISLRRSLDMTRQELVDMRISPAELDASLIKVNADIDAAASHYAAVRMTQEDALLELRTGMPPVMASPESPVDFNHERTQIKQVAIGADNLKLEVQYFSPFPWRGTPAWRRCCNSPKSGYACSASALRHWTRSRAQETGWSTREKAVTCRRCSRTTTAGPGVLVSCP